MKKILFDKSEMILKKFEMFFKKKKNFQKFSNIEKMEIEKKKIWKNLIFFFCFLGNI